MALNNIQRGQPEWKPYGNLQVLFKGNLIISPVRPWWWILEVYTFVGLGTFIYEHQLYSNCVLAGGIFLGLCNLLGSFKTTCSDPGVIIKPRPENALLNKAEAKERIIATGCRRLIKDVEVEDKDGKVKTEKHPYCHWCQHYRPPLTSHCIICDCCIKGFDHHCPVYGGCIGEKNKPWFIIMVAVVPLFWMYLLLNSAFVIVTNEKTSYKNPQSFPLTLYCVLLGFLGSIVLPPILSLFPRLDRVHAMSSVRKQSPFVRKLPPQSPINNIDPTCQPGLPSENEQNANEDFDESEDELKNQDIVHIV